MAILSKLKGHGLLKKIWTHERPRYSKKRERERKKRIWTHEGPMCFKRKLTHVQRNKREIAHERNAFIIHKNSTPLHILIIVYDLLLLKDPVFDLATQEE